MKDSNIEPDRLVITFIVGKVLRPGHYNKEGIQSLM